MTASKCLCLRLCLWLLVASAVVTNADDTSRSHSLSQIRNIAFDVADVTTLLDKDDVQVELEAYRSAANDRILDVQQCRLPQRNSQLLWVSIGQPVLLRDRKKNNSVFHMDREGFNVKVQMLTPAQREILAKAASRKYNITVETFQIAALPLSKFECTVSLYDLSDRVIIKGSVGNFQPVDLRVDFLAPYGTKERRLFEQELALETNINLRCVLASAGKEVKFNTLVITGTESQALGLTDKLFGPTHGLDNTVFITRQQMKALSSQMYSSLNILEDYELPQHEFSEAFVDEMVRQTAAATFKQVRLDQALQNLSQFGLESPHDLQVNDVKCNLAQLFNVTTSDGKTYIVVNRPFLDNLHSSQATLLDAGSAYAAGNYFPPISASASIKFVRSSLAEWAKGQKDLAEQMRELNAAAKDEIEWTLEDLNRKIVPRSISVAKLSRSNFSRTLSFSRVRRQTYDAPFIRSFTLYSSTAQSTGQPERDGKVAEFNNSLVQVNQQLSSLQRLVSTLQDSIGRLNASFTAEVTRLARLDQATANNELLRSVNQLKENSTAALVTLQTQLTQATSRIARLEQGGTNATSLARANSLQNGNYCLVKSHKYPCPPEFSNLQIWASNMAYCCNYT